MSANLCTHRSCLVFFTLLFCVVSASFAEDYTIGPKDVLQISVWQHSDLDRTVAVSSAGKISFPPIGELTVEGLTPSEVARTIAEKLRVYTRELSQVTVTVTEFNSRRVYVMGQVANPGIYAFEIIPNVWDVIRRAGGPTEDASLEEIRITTGEGAQARTSVIDLKQAVQEGRVHQLPSLRPGDTVVVPRKPARVFGPLGEASGNPTGIEQVISVMGAISEPGIYTIPGSIRLTEAIMLAGGPTPEAQLEKINVIKASRDGRPYTIRANYKEYVENGTRSGNPTINWGDAIFVSKKRFSWGITTERITTVLQISATVVNLYLLYRVIELGNVSYPRLP